MITNVKTKRASRCSECLAVKSFVDKAKNKNVLEISASLNFIKKAMLTYCVKCREKTKKLNPKFFKNKDL